MKMFSFPNQNSFYKGKVRDVYTVNNSTLIMVASNRISAFDVILPREIPFKGQVLNQIAAWMLNATKDICPNWLISSPAPTVSIGKKCTPFAIEMVVRGNLVGHAWRTYQTQKHLCGVELPYGMKENDFFPNPIITPSTKAHEGHDEDITADEIISRGLATAEEWKILCNYAQELFARGQSIAATKGLILADTKYEFGKIDNTIYLMDEIHTPDSSRYFHLDGFADRQISGERQLQLSKEFVREWLIANNFMGKEGQTVPEMSDDWINTISGRYIDLYEKLIGEKFVPQSISDDETYQLIIESINTII